MKKGFLVTGILALSMIGCSTPNNSFQDTSSSSLKTPLLGGAGVGSSHFSLKNFSDLEKEYKSFSTKALSDSYVSRMFTKFLTTSSNPTQVIRQLEFARYLKDVKSDTSYFNSLKNFIGGDSAKFNLINTSSGVPAKKTAESATFGAFVDSLNPTLATIDAQTFITAASITDTNQQNAIKTLVTDLKTYNIWDKMRAIYPFVGGTANSHKWNLKDPRDLNAAFRLTFSAGVTHDQNGITLNGTSGYVLTHLNNNTIPLNSFSMGVYNRTPGSTGYDMSSGGWDPITQLIIRYYNGYAFFDINNLTNASGYPVSYNDTGFFFSLRKSSNEIRLYRNGQVEKISEISSTSLPPGEITIGSFGVSYLSNRNYAFSFVSESFSDTEAANFYTAVQTFETTLGRQVN